MSARLPCSSKAGAHIDVQVLIGSVCGDREGVSGILDENSAIARFGDVQDLGEVVGYWVI